MTSSSRVTVAQRAVHEISALPAYLQASTLAGVVLGLAERLDADPSDREAVDLAREMRMCLADLRAQVQAEPEEVVDVGDTTLGH